MKITEFDVELEGEIVTHVKVEDENGNCQWIRKSIWDELEAQREQSGTL